MKTLINDFKFLLISILVILDVIASSTESKTDKSFEYLNLPPNLFKSPCFPNSETDFITSAFRLSGAPIKFVL